jgi:hypothetical protein
MLAEFARCEVCGQPTKSRFGACRRTRPCRAVSSSRRQESLRTGPAPFPCELCGKPTRSKYRACWRAGDCRKEYARQERAEHAERASRQSKAWRLANPERVKANQAAWNEANQEKLRLYMIDYQRQWRAGHQDAVLAYSRKHEQGERRRLWRQDWLQRADRPCGLHRSGMHLVRHGWIEILP